MTDTSKEAVEVLIESRWAYRAPDAAPAILLRALMAERDALQAKLARLEAALECLPDKIDIYREIKRRGARKHGDIAGVISDVLDPIRKALETPND